ncbi:MAG: patatin-like phospholipase family protein [Chthoniobacterales bacterium]
MTTFVLAGGGSLGAVQVGMLKALAREQIVPDLVVGASVGAINAAYYAADPSEKGVERLEAFWLKLRRSDIFPLSPLGSILGLFGRRDHIVSPAPLRSLIESAVPYQRLEQVRIPCHIVATDVLKGTETVLSSGSVATAALASAAIPGVFPTVTIEGRHLMDGGVANNTPISTAFGLGAKRIIVLPTGMSCALKTPPRGIVGLAMHALNLLIMRQLVTDIERFSSRCELVVIPPLCPLATTAYDFSQSGALIRSAEAATRLWLKQNGLQPCGAPPALLPHGH